MARIAKIIAKLVAVVVVLAALLVGGIEFMSWRASRDVKRIVAGLPRGTPYAEVVAKLGEPSVSYSKPEEVAHYGTQKDPQFVESAVLHKFVRRGPPYVWVLVYTDRESKAVLLADWETM